MWALLVNFLNLAIGQVFRAALIQFVVITVILVIITALAVFVLDYLIDIDFFGLANLFDALPQGLLFFLGVFQVHIGIPLLIGAQLTRFAIRRIPVIG